MTLKVLAAMEAVIASHNKPDAVVDEFDVASECAKSVPDTKALSADERRGGWAELSALRFQPLRESGPAPWDSYFGPVSSWTTSDGAEHYDPDARQIGADVIEHWKRRSEEMKQLVLRARYSDLVWDFCRLATKEKPDLRFAHRAIDSYLAACEQSLCHDEHQEWRLLDRAIDLSLRLKDRERISRAKTALFASYRRRKQTGPKFMWWMLDQIIQRRDLQLNGTEQEEVIKELEERVALHGEPGKPDLFDPHDAQSAAKRLASIHAARNDTQKAKAAMKEGGAAFEKAAAKAGGILATGWLQGVLRDYRDAGLNEDAARVEEAIRSRRADAEGEMKRIEAPVDIRPEEYEKWLDQITSEGIEQAFARIAVKLMVRDQATREQVRSIAEGAPLSALIPIDLAGPTGFTTARIGSVKDDFEGRVMHHAANMLNWEAGWLNGALARVVERYSVTANQVFAFVVTCPFFETSQHALIRQGIEAWLSGDYVKAIHVLIPRVEAALRAILRELGGLTMRPNSDTGGFDAAGMGTVLHSSQFREKFDRNARLHLLALYCDPKGLNLRNNVVHGLITDQQLGLGIANWVLHSVLLLSLLRLTKRAN